MSTPTNPVIRETALRIEPGWVIREYADGTFDGAHKSKPAITVLCDTFSDAVTEVRHIAKYN